MLTIKVSAEKSITGLQTVIIPKKRFAALFNKKGVSPKANSFLFCLPVEF
jgi:predicted ATP-dependent protease